MNTKKPRPPKNLMCETVVEINTDLPTAILRLQQINGYSLETDSNDQKLFFTSNRNGRFTVTQERHSRYEFAARAVELRGGLYVEEGKTKAVLYAYRLGGTVFGMIMKIVLGLVGLCYALWNGYILLQNGFSTPILVFCVLMGMLAIALPVHGIIQHEKGKLGSESDAQKLLEDALRRLDAINNWDK